jgi:hypothetical protein
MAGTVRMSSAGRPTAEARAFLMAASTRSGRAGRRVGTGELSGGTRELSGGTCELSGGTRELSRNLVAGLDASDAMRPAGDPGAGGDGGRHRGARAADGDRRAGDRQDPTG